MPRSSDVTLTVAIDVLLGFTEPALDSVGEWRLYLELPRSGGTGSDW
jgi:hypothetical protein